MLSQRHARLMSCLLCKTNGSHFIVRLSSDNTKGMSKREQNISDTPHQRLVAYSFFHTTFLIPSLRYQTTDTRQNEVYLLNKEITKDNNVHL